MKKRIISLILSVALVLTLAGCAGAGNASAPAEQAASTETAKLNIAYQYGLAYAPLIIAQDGQLIEKAYKEATGKDVEVTWTQMSAGADINTAIASGDVSVGFMGVGPAVTGVTKKVGYKIFTNLSGQEHGFMTNDDSINSLGDIIGSDKQIALVNIGSIQHIILAETLVANGYGAHDLDSNLVAMKHPDGMSSVETGAVACHLTSNPYIYKERENTSLHELTEVSDLWTNEKSFIVGVAAEKLHDEDQEMYNAVCDAFADAIDYINNNLEDAAAITCEYNGNSVEDEIKYMSVGTYSTETSGIFELAQFMYDNEFIENGVESYSDLVFDNVKGD